MYPYEIQRVLSEKISKFHASLPTHSKSTKLISMRNMVKILLKKMRSDLGRADQKLSPDYSTLKKFSDLVLKIIDIKTNSSPDKFSDVNAPLRKFIDVNAPLKISVIKEIKGDERAKVNPRFGKTKEYVAAEIKVLFPDLEDMSFIFAETVFPEPDERDQNKFYSWYEFKSELVVYVDLNPEVYNLVMMIRDKKIHFKKADERLVFNDFDRAIIDVFSSVFQKSQLKVQE